jgi:hypothetical protein
LNNFFFIFIIREDEKIRINLKKIKEKGHLFLRILGIFFFYSDIVTDTLSIIEYRSLNAWVSYYFMIIVMIISRWFSLKITIFMVENENKFDKVWKNYLFSFWLILTFYEPIYLYKK